MAIIIGAGIAAGGAIAGSSMSSHASKSAADTQAASQVQAQNIAQNQFKTIQGQESPYMGQGINATNALDYMLGIPQSGPGSPYQSVGGNGYGSLMTPYQSLQNFNVDDWKQLSPAYNFQMEQGKQGVLNSDSINQGALSGATMKDLMGYNQNLANTSFGTAMNQYLGQQNQAFNQYQTQQGNIYQRLAGLSQLGQASASMTGQQGTALSGQAGQAASNIGTALAGGQVGSANAYSSMFNNLGNLGMTYAMMGAGGQGGGYNPYMTDAMAGSALDNTDMAVG